MEHQLYTRNLLNIDYQFIEFINLLKHNTFITTIININ